VAELLAAKTPCTPKADVVSVSGVDVKLSVTTRSMPALDVYVDGRPAGPAGVSTPDGTSTLPVTQATPGKA
jgi:hypothetical protein